MSDEHTSENQDRTQGASRTWIGGFGRYRFHALWNRRPGQRRFLFQGPFIEDDDPDGIAVPFSPNFSFEWEDGQRVRIQSESMPGWSDLQKEAERITNQAAERTRSYRQRATRYIRDNYWKVVENELRAIAKKAMAELIEETLPNLLAAQNGQQGEGQLSPKVQRVPIEYTEQHDALDEDISPNSQDRALTTSLSRNEYDAQRRIILEELRTGAISLEEAESRLNGLGSVSAAANLGQKRTEQPDQTQAKERNEEAKPPSKRRS
jgi:hypothetical protein